MCLLMTVTYREKVKNHSDGYLARNRKTGFSVFYSTSSFGKYAKSLAELSDITNIKYNNIFIEKKNHVLMIIYSKKYGKCKIKVDKESISLISKYRWCIKSDKNKKLYVSARDGDKKILLHRLLCDGDIIG